MVLYVLKWDILLDTPEAYHAWLEAALQRTLAVPGVVEFRAYETIAGPHRKVVTYEFADLAAWQAWFDHREVQGVLGELDRLTTSRTRDLWGRPGPPSGPGSGRAPSARRSARCRRSAPPRPSRRCPACSPASRSLLDCSIAATWRADAACTPPGAPLFATTTTFLRRATLTPPDWPPAAGRDRARAAATARRMVRVARATQRLI